MVFIDIVIKAPNQKLDDQTFRCSLEWTVLSLKTHLSTVYPSNPRIEDQRLIYSGHLLKNEQTLRQVLQPIDDSVTTFTIHLVCAQSSLDQTSHIHNSPPNNTNTNTMDANNSDNDNNTDASNPTHEESNAQNNTTTANGSGIQYPLNGQFSPNMLNMGQFGNPSVMLPPDQMWQQMAQIQQAYAQYMTQYFNQNMLINPNMYQNNPMLGQTVPPMVPQHQPVLNVAPGAAIPAVDPVGAAVPPVPQAVQRMNAGPGGQAVIDDDEEPRNRDWLDCFYWMSRAVVLFSIIYFYSSFTRFLLVVFLSVLLYFYQTNWFNRNHNNNHNNNRMPQNAVNNNNNNNNNNNEMAVNREEEERNEAVVADDTEVMERPRDQLTNNSLITDERVTEERFTGLRFVWVVVSSLFTSLIPDNPNVPVNLN